MCTVTLIRRADGFRLVCNRDERRTRRAATAPVLQTAGAARLLFPVDPDSGGTWLGINDAGVLACLLNANPPGGAPTGRRSRGEIVPSLIREQTLTDAAQAAQDLDPGGYPPFRLLLADAERSIVLRSAGDRLDFVQPSESPLMLTSSSLGDDRVEAPRRALFLLLSELHASAERAQDVFHGHVWPDRPHLSVSMRRPDARTVSRTAVTLARGLFSMSYQPLAEDGAAAGSASEHRLPVSSARGPLEASA